MTKISTHFECLSVKALQEVSQGLGVYDVSGFSLNKHYRVLATFLKEWEDGSTTLIFLLQGPDDAIVEKACSQFQVAEVT